MKQTIVVPDLPHHGFVAMMRQAFLLGAIFVWLTGVPTPLAACNLCPPETGPTFLKQLESSHASVLAELVEHADLDTKDPVAGYRVVKVLKGPFVKPGDMITVPLDVGSPTGTVHLFFSDVKAGQWRNPLGITTQTRAFLERVADLPPLDEQSSHNDRVERLALMLPYLASPDKQAALSAHGEFSATPYALIRELKLMLDHKRLVQWINRETTIPQNRRILFQLLGVCENPTDIIVVNEAMQDRLKSGQTADLDSVLATYLTLRGSEGLDEIDRNWLRGEVPLDVKRAVASALRFHGNQNTIDRQRIIRSHRLLLSDPKTADYVIADLARWEDWGSLSEILVLWETRARNRWLRNPIQDYLKACPRSEAKKTLRSESGVVN